MYENRSTITQDYFLGGLDMLDSIETYIAETASYKTDKANN
jgi:hypothetical protein